MKVINTQEIERDKERKILKVKKKKGNTTYAAIAAVIMVNLILALYIITAYFETPLDEEKRPKKE